MTLIESPHNQSPTRSSMDTDPRRHYPSSKPTLWLNTASMEMLPLSKKSRLPKSLAAISPTLKKKHSTTVLSPSEDKPPKPERRNLPRRGGGVKPKAKKSPSTAAGAGEAVPRTASSVDGNTNSPDSNSSSPVSSRAQSGTGPIGEVTPWEMHPVLATTHHNTLATGPAEEVIPWALYTASGPSRNLSSIATGIVEDVTLRDLIPGSMSEDQVNSNESPSPSSGGWPSPSSMQSKSLSDLAQIRKVKHTRGKTLKAPSRTLPTAPVWGSDQSRAAGNTKGAISLNSVPASPKLSHNLHSTINPGAIRPPATSQNPRFSTADRTILEELKRNISAHAAQFTVKGAGTVNGCGIVSAGKKHHPFRQAEVPYPRSYDREVLDLDVWETVFCQNLCDSLTWHVFETPPAKVLDLGCGTGTWILNSARSWKECQFVGLDIVPLHPDLQRVGSPDLASRITWVQTNFLDGLPFPNEEFDFVHVKRIALGVPEDKWDFLLEEITRVMKPGGAFEMLEEDLFFPGKLLNDDSNSDDSSVNISSRQSSPRESALSGKSYERRESNARSMHSHDSADNLSITPASNYPETPSSSGCPSLHVVIDGESDKDDARNPLSRVHVNYSDLAQPKKTESTKFVFPSSRTRPQVKSTRGLPYSQQHPKVATSAVSLLLSSAANVSPPDGLIGNGTNVKQGRRRGWSLTAPSSPPLPEADLAQRLKDRSLALLNEMPQAPPFPHQNFSHFLLRTVPQPPANPRDHTLLNRIYTWTLESRCINTSPLAILADFLPLYFKDVRIHPALQHAFPPKPEKPPSHIDANCISDTDSSEGSDGARDAILPRPRSTKSSRHSHVPSARSLGSEESEPISEENRTLNIRGFLQHDWQHLALEDTRMSATRPDNPTPTRRGSRLSNATMNPDLKSLSLHLALRAAEILACSESMWEWVLEYQAEAEAQYANRSVLRNSVGSVRNSILDLTRDDFNGLLSKFDMDMRDKYSFGSAQEDRFSWSIMASAPSAERKIFDTACEKWEKWENEQLEVPSFKSYRSGRQRPARPATADSAQSPSRQTKYINRENDSMKTKKRHSVASGSALPPPTRLSRSTRVFTAWKA